MTIIVFDRKLDYTPLGQFPGFIYMLMEHFFCNILEPPLGTTSLQWLNLVAEVFGNYLELLIPSRTMFIDVGMNLHQQFLKRGSQLYPTILDIYNYVRNINYPAISQLARYRERIENRLQALLLAFGPNICSHGKVNWHRFFHSSWAISLEGIPTDLQNCFITLTILRILLYRSANNLRSSKLEVLIVLDEAATIFSKRLERLEGTPLLLDYMAKAREFGIGFLIGTQSLSGLADSVMANTATKAVVGGFGLGADYDIFASATGLNAEQKDFLKRLTKPGMACAKDSRYPFAFLLEIPRVVE